MVPANIQQRKRANLYYSTHQANRQKLFTSRKQLCKDLGILVHLSVEFKCHHCPRAEAYSPCLKLKSVLGKLVEILDEIKRVGRHYEPLNSAVHVARLETLEEFAQEEARLKDHNLWELSVSQLSKVGGRNNKDCVHKVMDRLFTNRLMASFNMKGRGSSEKKAFQETIFYSVVKAAVMKWSKTATEVEIRTAMAETLKHAPGRAGGGGRKV